MSKALQKASIALPLSTSSSSVNEICMTIAEARLIVRNNRIWGEKGSFGLRAISVPLDEPTFSPSPEKTMISKTIGHKRHRASFSYAIQQDLEGNADRINGHYLMKTRHPWE